LQRAAVEVFTALTVCHSLLVEKRCAAPSSVNEKSASSSTSSSAPPCAADAEPGGSPSPGAVTTVYQGPSPDEVALVDGARRLGVRFDSRSAAAVVVDFIGVPLTFEVLAVLEFSSERQRMSVVVRRPDGRITLFCKGADAALLALLAPPRTAAEADTRQRTEEHLRRLAVLVRSSRQLRDLFAWLAGVRRSSRAARMRRACARWFWRLASWTSANGRPGTRGALARGAHVQQGCMSALLHAACVLSVQRTTSATDALRRAPAAAAGTTRLSCR
jgi:hypothetical protein